MLTQIISNTLTIQKAYYKIQDYCKGESWTLFTEPIILFSDGQILSIGIE